MGSGWCCARCWRSALEAGLQSWQTTSEKRYPLTETCRLLCGNRCRECQVDVDDPGSLFITKFFLKQILFLVLFGVFFVVFFVSKLGGNNEDRVHHAINTMCALFSVCFLLLVRSNAAIWDCTAPEEDGGSWTLDEFPDVYYAVAIMALIVAAVPLVLAVGVAVRAHKAQQAQRDSASNDEEQGEEKAKGEKKTTKEVEKKTTTAKKERAEAELEFENPVGGTAGNDPPP